VGTGLVESMVAAAAARMGHSTLHMDTAKYYGGEWAAFTWDGLQEWLEEGEKEDVKEAETVDFSLQEGEALYQFGDKKTIVNIVEKWYSDSSTEDQTSPSDNKPNDDQIGNDAVVNEDEPQEGFAQTIMKDTKPIWNKETLKLQSRKFNLDLTPRLLFARGPMVELLISSNISRYTEFKSVTRVLTLLDGKLEQVPSSRSDVFNTKHISVVEKRVLMKFLTQCLQEEEGEEESDKTFGDFLKVHKLTPNLTHFVVHSIAMTHPDSPQAVGLKATRKFLSSLGRFGPTPFLWSMYGTGELPQAFCRLCAVFGGIYYLGRTLDGVVVGQGRARAVVTEGKKISCKHLVLPQSKIPSNLMLENKEVLTSRALFITKESLLPTEKEQITFLSLPQSNGKPVNIVEVGPGTAACPKGLHVVHASMEGEGEPGDIVKDEGIIKEDEIVYSLRFSQIGSGEVDGLENMWVASGPVAELDFDAAIQQARQIYSGMFPGEEFLPRAPDPEEIVLGEEQEVNDADVSATVNENQQTSEEVNDLKNEDEDLKRSEDVASNSS